MTNEMTLVDTFGDFEKFIDDFISENGCEPDAQDSYIFWEDITEYVEDLNSLIGKHLIAVGERQDSWKGHGTGFIFENNIANICGRGDDFKVYTIENDLYIQTYDHDGTSTFRIVAYDELVDYNRLEDVLYVALFEKRNYNRFNNLIEKFTRPVGGLILEV